MAFRFASRRSIEAIVRNLQTALDSYWSAKSPAEERAAYFEILLLGGPDGYAVSTWRPAIVRFLRRCAAWIEKR